MTVGGEPRGQDRLAVIQAIRIWLLTAVVVALGGLGLWLWALSGFATPPQAFMTGPVALLVFIAAAVAQTASGLLIGIRRPGNMLGWLILLYASACALAIFADGFLALAESDWVPPIDPAVVAMIPGVVAFSLATLTAVTIGMVFPDGRVAAPRYRLFVAATAVGAVLFSLGVAGTPGPIFAYPTYDNPLPVQGDTPWPALFRSVIGPLLLIAGVVATSAALVGRYGAADHLGRLQLRWYVTSAVVLAAAMISYLMALFTLPPDSPIGEAVITVCYLAAALPPIAIVIAISRYRLYDIDVIIGRAFVYGALTAILAGMYAASIRLFNALFVDLTGESSEAALVVTTLILATTFTPIKSRLERIAVRMAEAQPTPEGAGTAAPRPSPATADPATLLGDPAFRVVLDERIRVVLAEQRLQLPLDEAPVSAATDEGAVAHDP